MLCDIGHLLRNDLAFETSHIVPVDNDGAFLRHKYAVEKLDHRAFSRAVVAEDSDALALTGVELMFSRTRKAFTV